MTPIPDMTTRIYTIFMKDCCWTEVNKLQHLPDSREGPGYSVAAWGVGLILESTR
jgi:hypothetical protein